jgi:hypothetical protein
MWVEAMYKKAKKKWSKDKREHVFGENTRGFFS